MMINRWGGGDKHANNYDSGKGQRKKKMWKEVFVAYFWIISCKFLGRAK